MKPAKKKKLKTESTAGQRLKPTTSCSPARQSPTALYIYVNLIILLQINQPCDNYHNYTVSILHVTYTISIFTCICTCTCIVSTAIN